MAKFKVLAGKHNEGGRTYSAGEVVDSATDLNKLNYPGCQKFQQVSDDAVAATEVDDASEESEFTKEDLQQLTVADLREYAQDNEIDLEGVTLKDDIIKRILGES